MVPRMMLPRHATHRSNQPSHARHTAPVAQQWQIVNSRNREFPYGLLLTSPFGLGDQMPAVTNNLGAAVMLADMLNNANGFPALSQEQKEIRLRAPRRHKK